MVTRRKRKAKVSKAPFRESAKCFCGSCNHPHGHVPGYLLAAAGLTFLPFSMGIVPGFDWVARGWPILLVLFGIVLMTKAAICVSKK